MRYKETWSYILTYPVIYSTITDRLVPFQLPAKIKPKSFVFSGVRC